MSQCSLTATDTIKHQTISGLDRLTWPCQHHLTAESWSATPDRIWQQHEEECFHTYQHSQSPHLCTEGEGNMMLMGWSVPVEDMLWYFMSEYILRSEFQFQNQSCYKEDTVDNVNIFCQLCYRFGSESAILWSARAWQPYAKGSSLLYSVKQRKKKVFFTNNNAINRHNLHYDKWLRSSNTYFHLFFSKSLIKNKPFTCTLTSAPLLISSSRHSTPLEDAAARCSGVLPWWLSWLMLAPQFTSSVATVSCPVWQAMWSAVFPKTFASSVWEEMEEKNSCWVKWQRPGSTWNKGWSSTGHHIIDA